MSEVSSAALAVAIESLGGECPDLAHPIVRARLGRRRDRCDRIGTVSDDGKAAAAERDRHAEEARERDPTRTESSRPDHCWRHAR